jgi:hypothetical protein
MKTHARSNASNAVADTVCQILQNWTIEKAEFYRAGAGYNCTSTGKILNLSIVKILRKSKGVN